jgi:flagellin
MSDVTLSNGMRSNLLSLKGAAALFERTQERVTTGRKVNSAVDDPLNYFQSTSLRTRANALAQLLDGVNIGIKTLEAAESGLKAIERLIESMQGLASAASQSTAGNARLVTAADRDWRPNGLGVFPNVPNITGITVTPTIPTSFTPANGFPAPAPFTVAIPVAVADRVPGDATGRAAQSIANAINKAPGNNGPLVGGVTKPYVAAYVDSVGKFGIENIAGATEPPLSAGTLQIQVAGGVLADLFGSISPPTLAATATDTGAIGSNVNDTRQRYSAQFAGMIEQITNIAKDSSFNGVNLLAGQSLEIIFTEDTVTSLVVEGENFDAESLSLRKLDAAFGFQSNVEIDAVLQKLREALRSIDLRVADFASYLGIAKTREQFTKTAVKTLNIGADNLVLASVEEESANLLALQTRQQLSTQALSLAAQSEQAVLRLFN